MIEIMMLATTPRQLLAGKFMGLGLIGLLQAILWLGTGFVLLRFSGTTFQIPEAYQLPISFLIWGLIFFLLGYAVFASLMAGIGALVPNIREASQVTLIVMAPLLLPLMLISVLVRDPNGGLAVGLSLFPANSRACLPNTDLAFRAVAECQENSGYPEAIWKSPARFG
jgi:ABC-2 type transport system permease protein